MSTDHRKTHFNPKDIKSNSIQEEKIEKLLKLIDSEIQKSDKALLLEEFSDELDKLTSDIPTCSKKRKAKILTKIKSQTSQKISDSATEFLKNSQKPKQKKLRKSIILIATIFLFLFGSISVVAIAQGGYGKAWNYIVSKLKPGESVVVDGITIIKPYGSEMFASIEEYIEKENLNILYPSYLPDDIKIEQITEIDEGEGKQSLIFQFSTSDINFRVCNYRATQAESMISSLEYQTEYTKFYVQKMSDGKYISVGYYNDYEYYIATKNYDELILILDNLKGPEK